MLYLPNANSDDGQVQFREKMVATFADSGAAVPF